ncbi:MAG: hypothetical protein PVF33_09370 [Candidatus Latescibacterota bacterium]|jgi:hypothetical protein
MHIHTTSYRPFAAVLAAVALTMTACESTNEVVLPANIEIVAGNSQYSKKGTVLPEPLTVGVEYHDQSPADGVLVKFTVVQGGGSVSRSEVATDGHGNASIDYTLGPDTGTNRIRATVTGETNISVEFTATAGEYFCPEEDPTFVQKISPGGGFEPDLLLLTQNSILNSIGGQPIAGLVRLKVDGFVLQPSSFVSYGDEFSWIRVKDCAFSQNGDFFVAWQDLFDMISKIRPNKQADHFVDLETALGGEITVTRSGILVGCDIYGPFVMGCREPLLRFPQATFSGMSPDQANGDAVAVDVNPQNAWYEDIYYIDLSDNTLRRLPVDTLVAQGDPEAVYQLTRDQASGAKGMECADNGNVFILVDDGDDEKAILEITPAGAMSVVYDFFEGGAKTAEEAGILNDLAIWRRGTQSILYTIDTLNDVVFRYDVAQAAPLRMAPTTGYDPEAVSTVSSQGERVGLVVIPSE